MLLLAVVAVRFYDLRLQKPRVPCVTKWRAEMMKHHKIIESADPFEPPTCLVGTTAFYRFETKDQLERWLKAIEQRNTLSSLQAEIFDQLGWAKPTRSDQ
jgi:hypothetical protein